MGRRSRELQRRRIERERLDRQLERGRALASQRGCLFCRRSDGGFTSREHALPESLGNTRLVLAPGVVCDRCNNEVLSKLDQAICDFMPLNLMRTIRGVRSKAGRLPRFRAAQGTVEHVPGVDGADPTLVVNAHSSDAMIREVERFADGRVRLELKAGGGRVMTARYASELSRALLKAGLECAWLDHGEMMFETRFDHVRDAVLGRPRDGFFALENSANPDSTEATLTYHLQPYEQNTWRMSVGVQYFGVFLGTDSRLAGPVEDVPPGAVSLIPFSMSDFPAAQAP